MISLYKDPNGEKVFDNYKIPSFKSQYQNTKIEEQRNLSSVSDQQHIESLQKKIQELENIIATEGQRRKDN